MKKNLVHTTEYRNWLVDLKNRIQQSQIKAAIKVNTELLQLYWELGAQIVEKQANAKWGDGLIKQLSIDLMKEFPTMKGFSERNLWFVKKWYLFYGQGDEKLKQLVSELPEKQSIERPQLVGKVELQNITKKVTQIPWGHNLRIITKCKTIDEALFYVNKTIENGWSRAMLEHHLDLNLFEREGKSVSNFTNTLPAVQSDLAHQLLKDPYTFDFLTLTEKYNERELEDALVENITKFLLELGSGFAYVGRQVPLNVGGTDYPVDLLFYHLKLRCYVVIDLKVVKFVPEFAGKISFYLSAADDLLRHPADNPSIGLIICKDKNNIVAEYALRNINQPIGISEYQLTKVFPEKFKGSLPTIEEIEEELQNN